MKVTLILLLVAFAGYIGYRITRRMVNDKDPNEKPGCVTYGYVILVYLCFCTLSFPFIGWTGSSLYNSIARTRYEATIISVRDYEDTDDDGNTSTMYQPTVQFVTNDGTTVTQELGISSGNEFYVGEMHPVTFDPVENKVESRAFSTILLLLGALLMSLLLLGYVIIGFAYAYRIPIGITGIDYTILIFMYILLPLGMIGMNAGLIYYLVQRLYFGTKPDDPTWVLYLVWFFVIVLTLSKIGIVKSFLDNRKDKNIVLKD